MCSQVPAVRARRSRRLRCLLGLGLATVLWSVAGAPPARAVDFQIEVRKSRPAWSGYWWPMGTWYGYHLFDTTGPFTPLWDYAQWTGDSQPLNWERTYNMTSDRNNDWFGHCNAWAASCVMQPEPVLSVRMGNVTFNRGDIKGLLAAINMYDPTDYFKGARHDMGATSDNDLRAADFHRALMYYVAERDEGLIVNISTLPQVWSYPIDWFVMSGSTDRGAPDVTHVVTTVYLANDDVMPDYLGTTRFAMTYRYWVQGDPRRSGGVSDAGWETLSRTNHPQFIWHAAFERAYWPGVHNPNNISLDRVHDLVKASANQQATR